MKKYLLSLTLLLLLLCSVSALAEDHTCSGGTATCEQLAVCATCGKTYGHLADHNWGSWVSNDQSTHTRTCQTNSSHKETRYHSGGGSTCTQGAKCVYCGAVHDEPLGHIPTVFAGYPATCTTAGATDGEVCSRCGDTLTPRRVINAKGHTYDSWEALPGGLHTAVCAVSGCGVSGVVSCAPYVYAADDMSVLVCPICGISGDIVFPNLISRTDKAVPMGQLLVRGMSEPFPGVLYAFTVTGSYAGNVVELDGKATITLPEDLSALPAFTLLRVDLIGGAQTLTPVSFRMAGSQLTFAADTAGLYLLVPTE